MSDIDNLLDDVKGYEHTYYDESTDTPKLYMAEDTYHANIVKCETVDRMVKGKYKAKIYNITVKLSPECANNTYKCRGIDGKVVDGSGSDFVGRELRSVGFFQFLHPKPDDDFEANPGGNRRYLQFCEAVGKPAEMKEVDINGEKKKVKQLPNLMESDILGVPILAVIKNGKPWKGNDGKERVSLEVKWLEPWVDGKPVDVDAVPSKDDDIPF